MISPLGAGRQSGKRVKMPGQVEDNLARAFELKATIAGPRSSAVYSSPVHGPLPRADQDGQGDLLAVPGEAGVSGVGPGDRSASRDLGGPDRGRAPDPPTGSLVRLCRLPQEV